MRRVKHTLKAIVAQVLYALGLLQLWQHWTLRHRAVVLMYHRVLNEDERSRTGSHPGIVVSRETFARQMEVLAERFTVLSVDQFASHLANGQPFPNSSCLITFDDGWLDNVDGAVPALRARQLPALVFLPVNFIGERRLFWREALTHLLLHAAEQGQHNAALAASVREQLQCAGVSAIASGVGRPVRERIDEAVSSLAGMRAAEAERLTESLCQVLQVTVDRLDTPDRFIDWSDARALSQLGIDFGGHGAEHRLLGELPAHEVEAEVVSSKAVIEREIAVPVATFSYPNGSFTPDVVRQVRAAGYSLAFTTMPGSIGHRDDPFTLRRINIHEDMTASPAMFLARVVGLL